jgi:hypothetical protein
MKLEIKRSSLHERKNGTASFFYYRANERPAPFWKMVLDHFRESGEQKKNRFLQLKPIEKAILTEILVLIDTTKRSFWKCRLDNKRYNTPRLYRAKWQFNTAYALMPKKKHISPRVNAAIRTILFLTGMIFLSSYSVHDVLALQFVDSPRALPRGMVEARVETRLIDRNERFVTGRYGINAAFDERIILSGGVDYVHRSTGGNGTGIGDGRFGVSIFLTERPPFRFGAFARIIAPLGPNIARDPSWMNIVAGCKEISAGISSRMDIGNTALHASFGYGAREGRNGLYNKSFFTRERFNNDIIRASAGINGSWIYPVVPSAELYVSCPVRPGRGELKKLPVEGGTMKPVDFALGFSVFFSKEGCISACWIEPLHKKEGYINREAVMALVVQF